MALCERGRAPDALTRAAMRRLIGRELAAPEAIDAEKRNAHRRAFLERASSGPITHNASRARQPGLPPTFFAAVLGAHMKDSACLFEPGVDDLDAAEHAMLALTADRARIRDGHRILDLGCGWGAFSLWAARRYPHATIHAVSHSNAQREWITARAAECGLNNLTVETSDLNRFDPGEKIFDRIVSVEMLTHVRNYRALFARCATWLDDHGRLFVHVFAHKYLAYRLAEDSANDWIARHGLTGAVMPSESLFAYFQQDLLLRESWWLSGNHYRDTANAWLTRLDAARERLMPLMIEAYGNTEAEREFNHWRLRFMAMAELFGYRDGNEWGIAHYLFTPRQAIAS